jgi:hypothetical protein
VHSVSDMRRFLCTMAALVMTLMTVAMAAAQSGSSHATSERPTAGEIRRALAVVKADPNLATERTITVPRWNRSARARSTSLPAWFGGFIEWINESSRMLWWLTGATLAGILVVYIIRVVRVAGGLPVHSRALGVPTHVQQLDIRPETLPSDVGAAARAMWDRGEGRAALALLYRGMLSRLAHVHGVPIRHSSTEGDCLALSADRLPPAGFEYASRLVNIWQRAVYGGEPASTPSVHVLCVDFEPALNRASQLAAAAPGTSA